MSKNFDQIKQYYMQRKLRRFIKIDKRILDHRDDFIIVYTNEVFKKICLAYPEMENVHYLIECGSNKNHLIWKKSSGPISKLNEYLIKHDESEELVDEEELFQTNNEKIVLISAEPGIGKSLILDHFTQNSSAENFFIKIILNTCTKTLSNADFERILKRATT
jgi:transcriptional regulator of acetoin/glycerol metabolism